MTARRVFAMVIGATGPLALLALLVGNQWVSEAVVRNDVEMRTGLGPLLDWLRFPEWRLTGVGGHINTFGLVATVDFTTMLFLVLVAALVLAGVRPLEPRGGLFGALVLGWWATLVAGGLAGLLRGFLMGPVLDFPSGRARMQMIWQGVEHGLGFGFFYGWLAGVGVLVAFLIIRAPGPAAVRHGGMPMQQQPFPVQHPAAMPYMPPGAAGPAQGEYPPPGPPQSGYPQAGPPQQGYPQGGYAQPGWGNVPVQQRPGAVPPQALPPAAPSAAPAAPAPPVPPSPPAPSAVPGSPGSSAPSTPDPAAGPVPSAEDDAVAVVEPAQPLSAGGAEPEGPAAAADPPQDAPQDAPHDAPQDDAPEGGEAAGKGGPADETMVDPARAGGEPPLAPPQ
ncbi:hypothetical protein [Spirillospora sp. NBC_01491]|uniref:hypothetical protein n=1 Tax=Spirillospora sp. NBC_01491 TaxID=2976007 RepID=UPI002E327517|nr:hypothetical protein [Spirillospora sp. NBC_01491]